MNKAIKPRAARITPAKARSLNRWITAWKAWCAALLERQGTPAGAMRERERRQLFINGVTPREAAEQAAVSAQNVRPVFERMRKR
jgi:hypothetical protein